MATRRGKGAIEIVPTADWPRVIRALVVASSEFTDQLEELTLEALDTGSAKAQQNILAMPSKGHSRSNARATIAAALKTTTDRYGTAFQEKQLYARAEITGLPEHLQPLPRNFNKMKFRHPVFGDTSTWVTQKGKPGWFTRPFNASAKDLERKIGDLMDAIVKGIGASG